MNRRQFSRTLLEGVASYALVRTLFVRDAFARPVRPHTDRWVRRLHEMAVETRAGRLSPRQWQTQVHALFRELPLEDLVRYIDFERLAHNLPLPDLGVNTRTVRFPDLDGLPERLAFHSKIFGLRKDRAIIPHGHRNMTSCHYVLQGELHLRHYDKLAEDDTHMIIVPTVDDVARPGSFSSISDDHRNVHWLRALTETAFTFDVIVLDVGGQPWDVNNIDPYAAQPLSGGLLRAPKLDVETALAKYGHASHH